ncbi:ExbD/TolR family protein [Ferruginibacter albus]|uniref:ExbD/TolR family protein n=1 Tax=Ferruginibacter albus TaxID=2875540 RepID=UPI001CC79A91|nr:biopolymer transporter ExbD [Ferruginibacter albus]UAY51567.1 biopolymer transporter ExbD [Ferruginibacter albus]
MAEMDTSSGGGHKKGPGVKKSKKLSTRVDLTPMVDLGFLLITFFIFTTTLSQPTTMKLLMPKDDIQDKDLTKIKESGALTILLGKNDQVYYYEGMDPTKLQSSTFKKIRQVVLTKKANTPVDDLFITIKPGKESDYKNVVDILDEMTINDIKRYAIDNPNDVEELVVTRTEQANGIK